MSKKITLIATLVVILVLALPWAVFADDVANNADATVDATKESVALVLGGSSTTVDLYIVPTNGDGKNGCNLTGQTTLVIDVHSSNPSAVTASAHLKLRLPVVRRLTLMPPLVSR